ncbi:hypothetical protein HOP50_17g79840 [Chloropicon primus]|uniref:LysM domain-containing protein n=1 Tax=Chloropicon primus TaxID=1764295 RepID=A0A5B8N0Y3_9CHLO|nr:hypothetical protein A3770_17p79620 [Chloropicon primus]UPR04640.1 hypothetical protein HOP50_17g79840 [Chloropicon primus]|eukprot:QDZ25444.1 hypothetical protein A3770_17p79620 [Chloropicon primus]
MNVNTITTRRFSVGRSPPSLPSASRCSRSSRLVSCDAKKYHEVQKGEWLSSIAAGHNVTTEKLRKANTKTIGEGDMIFPGQQLVIPSQGSGTKGVMVKVAVVLLAIAAASGVWPTIKEMKGGQ